MSVAKSCEGAKPHHNYSFLADLLFKANCFRKDASVQTTSLFKITHSIGLLLLQINVLF